jgi:hypothetical protein
MPDELNYEAKLLSIDQARLCIGGVQRLILEYGWLMYLNKLEFEKVLARSSQDEDRASPQEIR